MLEHFNRLFAQSLLAMLSFGAVAQVDVDQSLTIEQYVNDVLLGEGQRHQHQFHRLDRANRLHDGWRRRGLSHRRRLGLEFGQRRGRFCAGAGCLNCSGGNPTDNDLLDIANSVPPLIGQALLGDKRERLVRAGIRLRSCRRLRVVQLRVWVQRVRSLGELSIQRHFRLLPFWGRHQWTVRRTWGVSRPGHQHRERSGFRS